MGLGGFLKKAAGGIPGALIRSNKNRNKQVADFARETDDLQAKNRAALNAQMKAAPKYRSFTDTDDFKKLKGYADGPEQSAYSQLAKQNAQARNAFEMDDVGAGVQQQANNAYSNLAMGGGLSSGARERIGSDVGSRGLMDRQLASRQGAQQLADIDMSESQQKAKAQESVLSNVAQDTRGRADFEQRNYETNLNVTSAQMKADAERRAATAPKKKFLGIF